MLLSMSGELYSWGRNDSGQLGVGNRVDQVSNLMMLWQSKMELLNKDLGI